MKKMNLKRIFNWLYGDGLDRAMTERRPREDREAISPVYRPVCVSYVARTMLVCLFLLLLGGWNSQAWGGNVTLKVTAESSPSTSGYVYVAKSNSAPSSYSLTSDYADEEKYSAYVFGYLTVEQTFYLFASAKDGYGFSGWSKNSSATYGDTSNPKSITVSGKKNGTVTDGPYYAIFTPITVSSAGTASTISFSSPDTKTSTLYFPVSNGADSNSDFYTPTISGEGWSISSWKLNTSTHKVEVVCSYMAYSYTSQGDHEATVTLTTKSNNSNTGKVKANVNLTPSLVADPTSLDFGMFTVNVDSKKSKTVTLSFNVNAITFSKTDDASIAPFSATFSGDYKTLTIYYQPTSVGTGTWERDLVVYAKNNQSEQLTATQTIKLKGQAQSITNPEYTCNIADNYMVDASALDLQSLWTSTSNGTITYSIVSFTPSSSNNIGATAPAITNNRLSLGQAGTLKLKLTQASATNFYAGEDTKTITIHKYNSAFANEKDLDVKVDANVTSSYSLNYSKPNAAYIGANHTAGTPTEGVNSTGFYYTLTQTVTSSNTVGSPDATVAIT